MSLHETAESIGYRNFHDMVSSNYTKDELIDHIREYLKDEEKKILVEILVEYLYNDEYYDIRDLFFSATGAYPCD